MQHMGVEPPEAMDDIQTHGGQTDLSTNIMVNKHLVLRQVGHWW